MAGAGNFSWALWASASTAAAAVIAGAAVQALRRLIYNRDDFDKHLAQGDLFEYLLGLSLSSSGLQGTPDPYIQAFSNLRYTSDVNSIFQGPSLKYIGKNATDIARGIYDPSGQAMDTNTRYHNAVRGAYNLMIVPATAWIGTKIGAFGTLASIPAAGFVQYATSPQASEWVATKLTGAPGTKLPEAKPGLPELPTMDALPTLPGPGDDAGTGPGAGQTSPNGGLPWGMMDDVAVPAWRAIAPVIEDIPGPVKWGAMGAAGLYGGYKFLQATEPYRNAPPPEKKHTLDNPD